MKINIWTLFQYLLAFGKIAAAFVILQHSYPGWLKQASWLDLFQAIQQWLVNQTPPSVTLKKVQKGKFQ